jgi:hypothetical protein
MEGEAREVGCGKGHEADDAPSSPRPFSAQVCGPPRPNQAPGSEEDDEGSSDSDHPQR